MSYPKPLSQKSIDKMLKDWNPETVAILRRYYEAFANLYGSIQLKEAWKVFKQFEPKIRKKQFIEFSSIARREDVPYYIYEIDELYSDEKRIDTDRFIIHKDLLMDGYGKFVQVYKLHEFQFGKTYYDKPDLLAVAAHRHHDEELRKYVGKMKFTTGEQKGKTFSKAVFLTDDESFSLIYYKNESIKKKIQAKADRPFSEKFMDTIELDAEFSMNPVVSIMDFLANNDYEFESQTKMEKFLYLLQNCINQSHLWSNCGYSPNELLDMYPHPMIPESFGFGPGIQELFANGEIDRDEIVKKLEEMGIDVID